MELSISYLKQRERKSPGTMISPSPNMLYSMSPTKFQQGNCNFSGKSMPLATVTITYDRQTQYMSQPNSDQRIGTATLNVRTPAYFIAVMAKNRAKTLLRNQCLQPTQSRAKSKTRRGQKRYFEILMSRLRIWSFTSHFQAMMRRSSVVTELSLDPPQQVLTMIKTKSRIFLIVS